jgi:hypothetical protein
MLSSYVPTYIHDDFPLPKKIHDLRASLNRRANGCSCFETRREQLRGFKSFAIDVDRAEDAFAEDTNFEVLIGDLDAFDWCIKPCKSLLQSH